MMAAMHFTDPRAAEVFAEYDARHQRELALAREVPGDAWAERRDEFLLPVGAAVGDFLRSLVAERKNATILELGTSYGYSTLFLADAARQCGGRVISMDVDAAKQDYAAGMLERAGLADFVEFRCGDAVELVNQEAGPFDLVLLDIWKNLYLPCFEAFYPRLAEEGMIVSDNMIYPESAREAVRAYRKAVAAKGDLQSVLLPLGSGIDLSAKWSADSPKL